MDGAALMKIAMIQMEVDSGQKDRNIRHAFQLLEQAVPNSDVLVLPELWTIGYDFHNLDKNATRLGDSLISGLSSFANYHHVTLESMARSATWGSCSARMGKSRHSTASVICFTDMRNQN